MVDDTDRGEYTVTVSFRNDLIARSEYADPASFVEACLTGNRARGFAWDVDVTEVAEQSSSTDE